MSSPKSLLGDYDRYPETGRLQMGTGGAGFLLLSAGPVFFFDYVEEGYKYGIEDF